MLASWGFTGKVVFVHPDGTVRMTMDIEAGEKLTVKEGPHGPRVVKHIERDISGGDLIGRAGNSLRQYCHDHYAAGCLPEGQFNNRWLAWGETMREIYSLLRKHR